LYLCASCIVRFNTLITSSEGSDYNLTLSICKPLTLLYCEDSHFCGPKDCISFRYLLVFFTNRRISQISKLLVLYQSFAKIAHKKLAKSGDKHYICNLEGGFFICM